MSMNEQILNVINAVIDYRRFICSNNMIFQNKNFDWYEETKKYFFSLPLPDGMKHNRECFNKILCIDKKTLDKLNSTESEELDCYRF